MAEYISKGDIFEILYQLKRTYKSKYMGFWRVWDEIKDWEGINEPFVRCRNCAMVYL